MTTRLDLDELWRREARFVRAVARRAYLASWRDPAIELVDVEQEAFLALVTLAERWDPAGVVSFGPYIGRGLPLLLRQRLRRLTDHMRRRGRLPTPTLGDDDSEADDPLDQVADPGDPIAPVVDELALQRLISLLTPKQARVLRAQLDHDGSLADLARRLGESETTVRATARRALATVRALNALGDAWLDHRQTSSAD